MNASAVLAEAPSTTEPTGFDRRRVLDALDRAERRLLEVRDTKRVWRGELSASALSTATAAVALIEIARASEDDSHSGPLAPREGGEGWGEGGDSESEPSRTQPMPSPPHPLSRGRERGNPSPSSISDAHLTLASAGLDWLAANANSDGGWGDTTRSVSNLSTTLLCWSALEAGGHERHHEAIEAARAWITERAGGTDRPTLRHAIETLYGEDRTFSIPILTLCTLAGVLGPRQEAFAEITRLPFELAALPQSWFRFVGLPVVSYALPALIAVGQVQHRYAPSPNPLSRWLRDRAIEPTLRRLDAIQPSSGGFLEAIPLTSFVAMSLAAAGRVDHPVIVRALGFLAGSVRPDGSWPIDIDLATWVTTLSIQALETGQESTRRLDDEDRHAVLEWLLGQQHAEIHPFTGADPGGWAWTDLPGGVPDADDTPGALLALAQLGSGDDRRIVPAAEAALGWLLGLQNRDGGMPTFCRGWGKLPFDRSAPDLSAHALRAIATWRERVSPELRRRLDHAEQGLVRHLLRTQRADGSWAPLWFGHEAEADLENPTYGTARCLRALEAVAHRRLPGLAEARRRGLDWLLSVQGNDGGWGGAAGIAASVEETALAVDALAGSGDVADLADAALDARRRGTEWLARAIDAGALDRATPIGFYFANLWYFEALYPIAFAVSALRRVLAAEPDPQPSR